MNWKKEYWLIVVAVACVYLYYYGTKDIPYGDKLEKSLPIAGGLAFGFNTLINLTK